MDRKTHTHVEELDAEIDSYQKDSDSRPQTAPPSGRGRAWKDVRARSRVHYAFAVASLVAWGICPKHALAQPPPPAPVPLLNPLATGPGTIIQSDFKSSTNGNLEVVVLQGNQLVHYWHDSSNTAYEWHREQVISSAATGIGPCSLIQSTLGTGSHGNFEVVVQEGTNLVHYSHDNSNPAATWQRNLTIATGVSGPGAIIQSTFGAPFAPTNFEVVVPIGGQLVHYWHDNSNPSSAWQTGLVVASSGVTGPGCLIESTFGVGNFEVVVPIGSNLTHFWHDNSNVTSPWQQGLVVTNSANGAGGLIQSTFGTEYGYPGNFEVVVPVGSQLIHFYHDNSNANLPWQQGLVVASSNVTGPGSIIQSDFGSGLHKNFEVVVENERDTPQPGATVTGGFSTDQRIVHYWHDNSNVSNAWQRDSKIVNFRGRSRKICQLTGDYDEERQMYTSTLTGTNYGMTAGDLGFPVESASRLYFFFGDSQNGRTETFAHSPYPESGTDDSVGYTTDTAPPVDTACTNITINSMNSGGLSFRPAAMSPSILQGYFNVPSSGFYANSNLYGFFWTNHCSNPNPGFLYNTGCNTSGGEAPSATFIGNASFGKSTSGGANFSQVSLPSNWPFVYTASVNTDTIPGLPPSQKMGILVYGTACYRDSTPFLVNIPSSSVENAATWRYSTGSGGWSSTVGSAVPIYNPSTEGLTSVADCPVNGINVGGCVGEMSITYNSALTKWLMVYNCGEPDPSKVPPICSNPSAPEGSVRARVADAPWGPWSNPAVIFTENNTCGDHGWCHFMHGDPSCVDNITVDNPTPSAGGAYGPFVLSRFSNSGGPVTGGWQTSVYYAMSLWNPYQVVIMRSDLFVGNNPP